MRRLKSAFRPKKQRHYTNRDAGRKAPCESLEKSIQFVTVRKYVKTPKVRRNDPRTADDFIREWAASLGSVREAGRAAGLSKSHLSTWLDDPNRRMNPNSQLKLARAADIPVEALVFRFTPIKNLDFWAWVDRFK